MNAEGNAVRAEAVRLIRELDKLLGVSRLRWIEATGAEKDRWWDGINSLLDQRLEIMAVRDAA